MLKQFVWIAVAVAGAGAVGGIAFNRGEPITVRAFSFDPVGARNNHDNLTAITFGRTSESTMTLDFLR